MIEIAIAFIDWSNNFSLWQIIASTGIILGIIASIITIYRTMKGNSFGDIALKLIKRFLNIPLDVLKALWSTIKYAFKLFKNIFNLNKLNADTYGLFREMAENYFMLAELKLYNEKDRNFPVHFIYLFKYYDLFCKYKIDLDERDLGNIEITMIITKCYGSFLKSKVKDCNGKEFDISVACEFLCSFKMFMRHCKKTKKQKHLEDVFGLNNVKEIIDKSEYERNKK